MRTPMLLAAALVAVPLALPAASAVDLCDKYAICLPPVPVDGCHFGAIYVRGDLPTQGCAPTATVYSCEVDYFGGSPSLLGNFRFQCQPVLTLP